MKKEEKKQQNQQGITLIALVVTIVVLLILAGVSIAMLTGDNGIITNAQKAQMANKKGEIIDKMGLAYGAVKTEAMVKMSTDPGYQPIKYIEKLAEIAAKELGLEHAEKKDVPESVKDGYHVYWQENGTTITMLYGDEQFALQSECKEENNLYPNIKGIISLTTTEVIYSKLPTDIENNNDTNTEGDILGQKYDKDTEIIIDGEKVSVPGGFTISGADGENTVANGLVGYVIPNGVTIDWKNPIEREIAQKTYDQFVWVPIKNAILDLSNNTETLSSEENIRVAVQNEINAGKYPMAIKTPNKDINGRNNYLGILYDFFLKNNKVKIILYNNWKPLSISGGKEPSIINDNEYGDESSYNDTNPKITEDLLQEEYNTMVEKVNSAGGFWIGRYETSNIINDKTKDSENKIKSIKGNTINKVNWYRMYAQQKSYSKLTLSSDTKLSSMIWGSQWDQVMIWMKEVKNQNSYYIINSLGMGNYESNIKETGSLENYSAKNIYDMAGNYNEWTLESMNLIKWVRVARGGYSGMGEANTKYRYGNNPGSIYNNSGSRITIY